MLTRYAEELSGRNTAKKTESQFTNEKEKEENIIRKQNIKFAILDFFKNQNIDNRKSYF